MSDEKKGGGSNPIGDTDGDLLLDEEEEKLMKAKQNEFDFQMWLEEIIMSKYIMGSMDIL